MEYNKCMHATPKLLSNGTDNVTVRYYVDGESSAGIAFKPPMAAGVGFDDQATGWGNAKIGRAGMGGWYVWDSQLTAGRPYRVHVGAAAGATGQYKYGFRADIPRTARPAGTSTLRFPSARASR